MVFIKTDNKLSPQGNRRSLRKSDIVNDSRVNIVNKIPISKQGRNGDMLLYVTGSETILYCKIKNNWRPINVQKSINSSKDNNMDSNAPDQPDSYDSGWLDVIDEIDNNNIDPEDGSQRKVTIHHGLNASILDINVVARFEALENGELKTYIISLDSHISSPGPNASKFGYWINIRDNNNVDLYIYPDGISIIHSEGLKDSSGNKSILLNSKDDTNIGALEIRVILRPITDSNNKTIATNYYRAGNSLRKGHNKRTFTGQNMVGDKGASIDGTKNSSFAIDSDGTGVLLKNDSGVLKVRNIADNADVEIQGKSIKLTQAAAIDTSGDLGKFGYNAATDMFQFVGSQFVINGAQSADDAPAILGLASETGSDAYISINDSSTAKWRFGYDQSDSGNLIFCTGSTFADNIKMKLTHAVDDANGVLHLFYNSTNYATLTTAANGATTITTEDSDGAAGHLTLEPDGDLILKPGGDAVMTLTESGDDGNSILMDSCAGFVQKEPTYNATTTVVDFRHSNKQFVTFGAGSITNANLFFPLVSGNFILLVKQDGTGSRTISNYKVYEFDESAADGHNSIKWAGGTQPTLTTDANHVDILSFYWDADNEIAYGTATLDFQF